MRGISQKNIKQIEQDEFYTKCARYECYKDHECQGRITREHALIYASRQVDEVFAIVPICAFAHGVDEFQDCGILDKEKNQHIALSRATEKDFAKYYKSDWKKKLEYFNSKFGKLKF